MDRAGGPFDTVVWLYGRDEAAGGRQARGIPVSGSCEDYRRMNGVECFAFRYKVAGFLIVGPKECVQKLLVLIRPAFRVCRLGPLARESSSKMRPSQSVRGTVLTRLFSAPPNLGRSIFDPV